MILPKRLRPSMSLRAFAASERQFLLRAGAGAHACFGLALRVRPELAGHDKPVVNPLREPIHAIEIADQTGYITQYSGPDLQDGH